MFSSTGTVINDLLVGLCALAEGASPMRRLNAAAMQCTSRLEIPPLRAADERLISYKWLLGARLTRASRFLPFPLSVFSRVRHVAVSIA